MLLIVQGVGCSRVEPAPDAPPGAELPADPGERPAPAAPETPSRPPEIPSEQPPPSPPPDAAETALACEALWPGEPGTSRSITLDPNGRDADCGPGTSNGAGFLALMNSGYPGVSAWDIVTLDGVDTENVIVAGDSTVDIYPQLGGFYVIPSSPGGVWMSMNVADGDWLGSFTVTDSWNTPYDVAPDPAGGALVTVWEPREGNLQVLTSRFVEAHAQPRTSLREWVSAPTDEARFVIAGVDTRGRGLLLWPEPSGTGWVGRWLNPDGTALTAPFTFPAPPLTPHDVTNLYPLAGGGLALRSGAQWIAHFPSGETTAAPAPDWLASHPGSDLVLVRGGRAHALIPPSTFVEGAGCRETLLLFTQDGTACGEVAFPLEGDTCFQRRLGIGVDGTVVQQVDALATHQCAWRWWPGFLK